MTVAIEDLMERNQRTIEEIQAEKDYVMSRMAGIPATKKASRSVASAECPGYVYGIPAILIFAALILAIFIPGAGMLVVYALGAFALTFITCFIIVRVEELLLMNGEDLTAKLIWSAPAGLFYLRQFLIAS